MDHWIYESMNIDDLPWTIESMNIDDLPCLNIDLPMIYHGLPWFPDVYLYHPMDG